MNRLAFTAPNIVSGGKHSDPASHTFDVFGETWVVHHAFGSDPEAPRWTVAHVEVGARVGDIAAGTRHAAETEARAVLTAKGAVAVRAAIRKARNAAPAEATP